MPQIPSDIPKYPESTICHKLYVWISNQNIYIFTIFNVRIMSESIADNML